MKDANRRRRRLSWLRLRRRHLGATAGHGLRSRSATMESPMTELLGTTVGEGAGERAAATAPFPLTDLQTAYLVGASRLVELGGFAPTFYIELDMVGLVPERAAEAMRLLVRRHPHLRTTILAEGAQRVHAEDELPPYP